MPCSTKPRPEPNAPGRYPALLYAVSKAPADIGKAAIALSLLDEPDLALSVQVLQESYVQATRPNKADRLTREQAAALIQSWLRFPVQEISVDILRAAVQLSQRFQLSYWDAAIIEAARALGCREVLSEDLNAGQDYGGLTVVNPFRPGRSLRQRGKNR
ncbi:MAG: PIN domain-containing protein [Pirellulaceae bacterium]